MEEISDVDLCRLVQSLALHGGRSEHMPVGSRGRLTVAGYVESAVIESDDDLTDCFYGVAITDRGRAVAEAMLAAGRAALSK